MDEQIKNEIKPPQCAKCGRSWEKTVPLVYIGTKHYCGDCVSKFEANRQKLIEELME